MYLLCKASSWHPLCAPWVGSQASPWRYRAGGSSSTTARGSPYTRKASFIHASYRGGMSRRPCPPHTITTALYVRAFILMYICMYVCLCKWVYTYSHVVYSMYVYIYIFTPCITKVKPLALPYILTLSSKR